MNDAELSLWQYREIASDWRPFSMTNFVTPDFLQREIEYRRKGGGGNEAGVVTTLDSPWLSPSFCRCTFFVG